MTRLTLAFHGTRSVTGQQVARQLAEHVAQLTGRPTQIGFVDVVPPRLHDVAQTGDVIVPCFLGSGYHVQVDVAAVARERGCQVAAGLTVPGEDPPAELIDVLVSRMNDVGGPGEAVVLGWAGSSSPVSVASAAATARALEARIGVPVQPATARTAAQTVSMFRTGGKKDVVIATYLLAPGYFADKFAAIADARVTPAIGAHLRMAQLIGRRARRLYRD